jgi:hypothetical protein
MSLGNLAFDQAQLAPNRSSAYMHSFSDATGTSHENVTDPRSYRRENRLGSNALNIADVQDVSLATSESSSRLEASATSKSKQADLRSCRAGRVLASTASSVSLRRVSAQRRQDANVGASADVAKSPTACHRPRNQGHLGCPVSH